MSVFTAVSAFCNAGFDLFGRFGPYSWLVPYVHNYYVQAVIMFMIMAGGLGFMVWVELASTPKAQAVASCQSGADLLLHSLGGWCLLIGLMEWNNPASMGGLCVPGKMTRLRCFNRFPPVPPA